MEENQPYYHVRTFPMTKQWSLLQPSTQEENLVGGSAPCCAHNTAPISRSFSCGMIPSRSPNKLGHEYGTEQRWDLQCSQESCAMCFTRRGSTLYKRASGQEYHTKSHHSAEKGDIASRSQILSNTSNTDVLPSPDGVLRYYEATAEQYENGAVVAAVVGLGVGCVALCCIWHLIHLLPLILIPFICFYRKNVFTRDFIFACHPSFGADSGEGKGGLEDRGDSNMAAVAADDRTVWKRMIVLEEQNEQLIRELNKQRQATELLLRQLDDFTSKSYNAESAYEQITSHCTISEEHLQNPGH